MMNILRMRAKKVNESLILPAIEIAALSKRNSTFRQFTNKIFQSLSKEKGVSEAAQLLELLEDEIRGLFNLGKTAKETIQIIQQEAIPY
jgi:hypothetical protein